MLVEHAWARALDDAVERTGGTTVANGFVEATELAELAPGAAGRVARRGQLMRLDLGTPVRC